MRASQKKKKKKRFPQRGSYKKFMGFVFTLQDEYVKISDPFFRKYWDEDMK